MDKIRWIICPRCDEVQPIGKTWRDEGGYLLTECEFCQLDDVPYQIDVSGFQLDSVTDDEEKNYRRLKGE
jgi:hypothetical protein